MSDSTPDAPQMRYEDLAELFRRMGSGQSPTTLHGSLTGVLAAGHRMSAEDWVAWAVDLLGPSETVEEGHHVILKGLYVSTLSALEDTGMSFKPLLPADNAPLADRLEALSDWCGSFLGAFGTVGVVSEGKDIPEEIEEVLEDLSAIAQVDTESDEDDQAEEDFVAISEHVRMGALTLFLEYNQTQSPDGDTPTVH